MPDPPRSSSQKRLSEAPSSAAVKEESRVLSSDGVGPPHNKKSVSARQRTPERGRPRIGSTVVAPPLASSQQSPAPALNTSASSSQNAHNSTIPSSLAEHLSPRVRSRSRPRGEEDGVVDGRASGNWRMMSISQLLRRDTDGEVVTGDSKSDRASVGGASNRPPSPTSPGMNNTRNWLGSFLSRATSGNEIKSEARPDTPGDGFSPLMSRRSSSRQRRGSDANDDASSDRASQHTDSTPMPSRLPWLSRKAHADEKRKSVHSESELAASDRRKSVISESDYVSASARKSPGGQRKSVGGSDTEGEGDAKSSGEKKKTWKLFSRVGGSSTDDLSLESQGRGLQSVEVSQDF
ncbi:hypothetical protein DFJ73DRAFT_54095 [Zopfochytrium polystomum]|nr:hypothetical protein DFJ73DRAFT_54095 [Zopfochytrium polystomum]